MAVGISVGVVSGVFVGVGEGVGCGTVNSVSGIDGVKEVATDSGQLVAEVNGEKILGASNYREEVQIISWDISVKKGEEISFGSTTRRTDV